MFRSLTTRRVLIALALAAALGCGIRNFYVSPEYSRAFSHVPDSVENTLAMKNLMDGHGFTLRLNGVDHPSRYQPWFSLLFVYPALVFAGGNVLCAWCGVFAAGALALFAAFLVGRKIGGGACGVLLAAVLGVFADFARYANVPMTEVPYAMLLLFAAAAWLNIRLGEKPRVADHLLFGVLCALAGALRSTALVLPILVVLPLWKRRPGWKTAAAVLAAAWLPALAVAAANAIYNRLVFGEFFRSGYHFWDPVNYDYPEMTFGWRFFVGNLQGYANVCNLLFLLLPAVVTAVGWIVLRRRDREAARKLGAFALFVAAVTAVTMAVYLPYFSYQERFFVPVRALAMLCAAAAAALTAADFLRRKSEAVLIAVALAVALAPWGDPCAEQLKHDSLRSAKIDLLIRMRETLPENAVLLTVFQQGAAEYFFVGRSGRRIIPFFRCYEYAQMVTAKRRMAPPPGGFGNMELSEANRYLAEHGGARPYPTVYSEAPEEVDRLIRSGVPVYVSGYTLLIHRPARELGKRYDLVPAGGSEVFKVFRLTPRSAAPGSLRQVVEDRRVGDDQR